MTTPETARTEGGTRARVLEVVTRSGPVTAVIIDQHLYFVMNAPLGLTGGLCLCRDFLSGGDWQTFNA